MVFKAIIRLVLAMIPLVFIAAMIASIIPSCGPGDKKYIESFEEFVEDINNIHKQDVEKNYRLDKR